jgi:hypothetical protein
MTKKIGQTKYKERLVEDDLIAENKMNSPTEQANKIMNGCGKNFIYITILNDLRTCGNKEGYQVDNITIKFMMELK